MYEIPQQLEYKEKIVFELTFGQLAYAFGFAIFILLIFRININFYVRFILSMPFICMAIGFMFFDLGNKVKDYYFFFKYMELRIKRKDTKLSLFIKKIENIFRKEGSEEKNEIKKKNKKKIGPIDDTKKSPIHKPTKTQE